MQIFHPAALPSTLPQKKSNCEFEKMLRRLWKASSSACSLQDGNGDTLDCARAHTHTLSYIRTHKAFLWHFVLTHFEPFFVLMTRHSCLFQFLAIFGRDYTHYICIVLRFKAHRDCMGMYGESWVLYLTSWILNWRQVVSLCQIIWFFFLSASTIFSLSELLRWTTLHHPPPTARPPAPLVSDGLTDGPVLIKWRRCESRQNLWCKSAGKRWKTSRLVKSLSTRRTDGHANGRMRDFTGREPPRFPIASSWYDSCGPSNHSPITLLSRTAIFLALAGDRH